MHVYCKIDTDTNKNKRIVANENTYIKTLETLKGKCNLVTNSESLSDLGFCCKVKNHVIFILKTKNN